MSDTTISELPLTTFADPSDVIALDRGDRTYKIQLNSLNGYSGANILYVSTNGDDFFNTGNSLTSPFKTLKKALKHINDNPNDDGYVLYLNSGEYIEKNPLVLPRKTSLVGQNEKRVIIKPDEPSYDMIWINDGCYIGGITFKGNASPSSVIAYPKFINQDIDVLDITDVEYLRAYHMLGFEMDRPLEIPIFLSEPKVECITFDIKAIKAPIQIGLDQVFDYSKTATGTSYSMFEKLYNNSVDVITYGISATEPLHPVWSMTIPAHQEVINYLQNKINHYELEDDIFSIVPYAFQNFGINLLDESLKYGFFRDVKFLLNSLVYDISANSNRLILEAGKTYYNNISSLILPNDNTTYTKQIVLSTLNYIYDVIKYEVFEDVLNVPGTIHYFINNQFDDLKNYLNGSSVLSFPPATLSSSYIDTSLLLSANKEFILEESYAYIQETEYEIFDTFKLNGYKNEIEFIFDSLLSDLNNNINSSTIHYSNLLYDKINHSDFIIKKLFLDAFKYVGDVCKKVIVNLPVSELSKDCGDAIRIDGNLVKGMYNRTLHVNDINAIIQGGKGVWVKNNGNVNINNGLFTCCSQGILCESGGNCIADSCTTMFGSSGIVALGVSPVPVLSGVTSNQTYPLTADYIDVKNLKETIIYGLTASNNTLTKYPFQGMVVEFLVNNNPLSAIKLPILNQPTKISDSEYRINFPENLSINIPANTKTNFYFRSIIKSDSHNFEYVGSGNILKKTIPSLGGATIKEFEVCYDTTEKVASGMVYFNSIDQSGNVSFGKNFVLSQDNNRIEGYAFDRSVISLFTPFAIAME